MTLQVVIMGQFAEMDVSSSDSWLQDLNQIFW